MKNIILITLLSVPFLLSAQARIEVENENLSIDLKGTAQIKAIVVDENGNKLESQVSYFSRSRRSLSIDAEGNMTALQAGPVDVILIANVNDTRIRKDISVMVNFPAIKSIEL